MFTLPHIGPEVRSETCVTSKAPAMVNFTVVLRIVFLLRLVKSEGCLTSFLGEFMADRPMWIVHTSNRGNIIEAAFHLEQPVTLLNITMATNFVTFNKPMDKEVSYVIALNNLTELNGTLDHLKGNSMWRSKSKHLVYLEEKVNKKAAKQLFKSLWEYDVYNAAIVHNTSTKGFTWYPYRSGSNCGARISLKTFNICSSNIDPFGGKIPNKFHGCPVNVAWFSYHFFINNPLKNKNPGVIINLLQHVENGLGLKIKYDFDLGDSRELGKRLQVGNCSLSQILSEMEANKTELLLHSLIPLACDESFFFDYSASFYSEDLLWILPHRKPLPTWILFQKIFNPKEYFLLLLAYLLLVGLWKCTRNSGIGSGLFSITKLFLFQSVGDVNSCTKIVIFITGSFLTLHISYVFSSRLFSVLTTPLYDPYPSTVDQLANSDFKIYENPTMVHFLKVSNPQFWKKAQKKLVKLRVNRWDDLLNGTVAFAMPSTDLIRIKNIDELKILPERVS